MTPTDRAELCLLLLLRCQAGEEIACLQAMQRLAQAELARRWAESPLASVGHVLSVQPVENPATEMDNGRSLR